MSRWDTTPSYRDLLGFLLEQVVMVIVPLTLLFIFLWAKTNKTHEKGVEKHLGKQATQWIGNSRARITTINYKHYNKLSLLQSKLPCYTSQHLYINHQ